MFFSSKSGVFRWRSRTASGSIPPYPCCTSSAKLDQIHLEPVCFREVCLSCGTAEASRSTIPNIGMDAEGKKLTSARAPFGIEDVGQQHSRLASLADAGGACSHMFTHPYLPNFQQTQPRTSAFSHRLSRSRPATALGNYGEAG